MSFDPKFCFFSDTTELRNAPTIAEMRACIAEEMRHRFYPIWVTEGRMTAAIEGVHFHWWHHNSSDEAKSGRGEPLAKAA